jgi:hypothetical protein
VDQFLSILFCNALNLFIPQVSFAAGARILD